jgi:hypothetical protein
MTTFTLEKIAELRKVCDAATPGPWENLPHSDRAVCIRRNNAGALRPDATAKLIISADLVKGRAAIGVDEEDRTFIATARTALPAALDEIERLTAELEQIAAYVEPHFKGAGLSPHHGWIIKELAHRYQTQEREIEQAEAERDAAIAGVERLTAANIVAEENEKITASFLETCTRQRDAAIAERDALIAERAGFPNKPDWIGRMITSRFTQLEKQAQEADAKICAAYDERNDAIAERDRLRAAIRPFADAAQTYEPDDGDSQQIAWVHRFTIGALRAARAAIRGRIEEGPSK